MNQHEDKSVPENEEFSQNETGATAIEYGLIGALVAVVIIGALIALGDGLVMNFAQVSCQMRGINDCSTCMSTLASETGSSMFDPSVCTTGGPGGGSGS